MKFQFSDDELPEDTWEEYYPSLEEIGPEMLEGCSVKSVFNCEVCKEEIITEDHKLAITGICIDCK